MISESQAIKLFREYLEQKPIFYEIEKGSTEEGITPENMIAQAIISALFEENENSLDILKELIPMGNPLMSPDMVLNEAKQSEEKLKELHSICVAGLNHEKRNSN